MILIQGYTEADKVPGAVAQLVFGAGRISIGAIPLECDVYGNKTSGGTALAASKTAVTTPEEAVTLFGARSELANMCYAALDIPGVKLNGIVVAEAGGAAGTSTLTIGGSWTTTGEITLQLDHVVFRVTFGSAVTTVTLAAAEVVLKTNQLENARLFCTANNASGVVTFTVANLGVRGNQHTLYIVDKTKVPSGMTAVIAGGTALPNGGVPFTGGTGTDDVTAALAAVTAAQNDYQAFAQNDATNMGLVETAVNAKAAFDVMLYEQYVTCLNGILSGAIAIGQTQMNDVFGLCGWTQYGVEHPSRVAARVAATFSVTDGDDPNHNYDDEVLRNAAPQFVATDCPSRATKNSALNAGITPFTTVNQKLQFVRAINSHCLNGSTPDFRTYDHSETTVPIRMAKELLALYGQIKAENPYAGPNVGDGLPPEGTLTPLLWDSAVTAELKKWEGPEFNWLTDVDNNLPQSEWNTTAKRIMSIVPGVVKPQNHQIGIIVRQQAA